MFTRSKVSPQGSSAFLTIAARCLLFILIMAPLHSSDKPLSSVDNYKPGDDWKLEWSDEFNGVTLDRSKWNFDLGGGGWGNFELQGYTSNANNLRIADGKLVIQAHQEDNIYFPFSSARINTKGKFSFLYGKIAARIRLPYGKGVWPAFWMMGDNKDDVGWPRCGEIDIMEITGGGDYGDSVVYGTAHWYSEETSGVVTAGQTEMNTDTNAAEPKPVPFHLDYHVFELEWSPQYLKFSFDGKEFNYLDIETIRPEMAIFHKKFYILLNLAIGGGLTRIASAADVTAKFPQTMSVDWVRVYKKQP